MFLISTRSVRILLILLVVGHSLGPASLNAMEECTRGRKRKFQQEDVTLKQFDALSQTYYEESKENILDGGSLCGLFATYNGVRLVYLAQTGQSFFGATQEEEIEKFNMWLAKPEVAQIIFQNRARNKEQKNKDAIFSFSQFEIEDLIRVLTDDVADISVINSEAFDQRADRPNLLGNYIFDNVHWFRKTKAPQLILWVSHGHWIAIVLTSSEIWVMDSLNIPVASYNDDVTAISDFFRSEKMSRLDQRKKLGKRSAPTSQSDVVILISSDSEEDQPSSQPAQKYSANKQIEKRSIELIQSEESGDDEPVIEPPQKKQHTSSWFDYCSIQ